jgi:hypothetical protein
MKCGNVEELLVDYLDGKLEEEIRIDIERHLVTCESCLDMVRESKELLQLFAKEEMIKPDETLRINFYHMLHSEIRKNESLKSSTLQTSKASWYNRSSYRIAAGFAILICGSFLGALIFSGIRNNSDKSELAILRSEVNSIKRTAMFTMLKEESSSDRIQAVYYADDLENADENVINVLLNTLNQDKNSNVRLAAAFALSKYAGQKSICDSLVKSLSLQDDPIVQVTLINILVERKEKSAIKPIQKIISDSGTLKEVKIVAEKGVKQLI